MGEIERIVEEGEGRSIHKLGSSQWGNGDHLWIQLATCLLFQGLYILLAKQLNNTDN